MWKNTWTIVSVDDWVSLWIFMNVRSPGQPSEDVLHVGVVSPRLGDGDAQLGVAQRPDCGDDARDDPDDQGHAHGAGVLHHSLWTDEDTWADDVTWWKEEREGREGMSVFRLKNTF